MVPVRQGPGHVHQRFSVVLSARGGDCDANLNKSLLSGKGELKRAYEWWPALRVTCASRGTWWLCDVGLWGCLLLF